MSCTTWRLCRWEELPPDCQKYEYKEFYDQYGGRVGVPNWVDVMGLTCTNFITDDGRVVCMTHEFWIKETRHQFIDTGTKRTWCKCCDANGHYDMNAGGYVPD